jgi:hypothetical protein
MPIQLVYFSRPISLEKLLRDPGIGKIFPSERKETRTYK